MTISFQDALMSARLGLGAFAAVVAFLSMFPAAMPAGYEHLVPGPDAMSGFFLVAHHVGNLFLAICAVWLMSGRCTRGGSLLSVALLSFYVYLVRVSFDPPLGVLVAFSALVLVILAYIAWRMTSAASIMVCRHRGRSASTGEVDDRA